ncbi:MAG TPA: hypothetical protein VNE40_00470 [Candidatus Dormibacteraeota bacterium]|nr:hypothetical protein [Candidatus Dormibacteraeota bacterium]
MKSLTLNQRGFGFLTLLLVLVVIGAVTVIGLKVAKDHNAPLAVNNSAPSLSVPAKLQTKSDVQKAAAALDAIPVSSGVNPNQLNSDLNSLL